MPGPRAPIFIGYRRQDSQGFAGRLEDDLIESFGEAQVFRDDDIPEGEDFTAVLGEALEACSVLIVVIGPDWLEARDSHGQERLRDPGDWVRREIESALERHIWVLPVLVGGAAVPRTQDLPEELAGLSRVQAVEMSDRRWEDDLKRLVVLLTKRIPALRQAPGVARRLGPMPSTRDLLRGYLDTAANVGGRRARSNQASPLGFIARLIAWALKRVVFFGLAFLLAWFLLENYASAEVRQGVTAFMAFVLEKVTSFWPSW